MTILAGAPLEPASVEALRTRFRGALLRPGEEGFDEARRVWNGAIDRRPALIARCAGADDVVEAVRFARERNMLVSVRGGGHAVAGHAVCDDGVMIDLSLMKAVHVNAETRIARAAGGVLWGELDRATQGFGLATTGGVISHTGIAGLTLGGGLGHLMRKHGLTVDSLVSVDVVTAEGRRIRSDDRTEPDLFWGVRGGGGNFGIATSFEYRLHPTGPMVFGGPVVWPLENAQTVLRFLDRFAAEAPDELGITLTTRLAPPMPMLPPDRYGTPVVILLLVWSGDPARGREVVEPLLNVGTPIAEAVRPVPYLMIQSMLDGGAPHGMHYYWKSHRLPEMSDDVIDVLVQRLDAITSPFSQISGWAVGGAVTRADPDATAVGSRERKVGFEINVTAAWPARDPEGERHTAWVREGWDLLSEHASGVYANFLSDEGASGVEVAYGDRLTRLRSLKDRYDPTNFFSLNANIEPSHSSASS
ncbi:MAG: FAD-binding oxidoreductase [Actinomycetota bacterium]